MKKVYCIIIALAFISGTFSHCGKSLPGNARNWLKRYDAMGKESVEIAKNSIDHDRKIALSKEQATDALPEYEKRLNALMEEMKIVMASLNEAEQETFSSEFNKITERIREEKEKYQ